MAMEILTNVPDFEKACIDWHDGIAADTSWDSFMSHFEDAHDSLAQVRGTTMAQAGYQPMANMVASQFEEIEQLRRQIQDLQSRDPIVEPAAETPAPAANHTATNDPVQIAMLSTLATIASQLSQTGSGNDRTNSQRSQRNNERNGERRQRRDISKYCYTHGACAHTGTDCRAKTTGHQDAATFANKMGGSTLYCRTATAWQGGTEKKEEGNQPSSSSWVNIIKSTLKKTAPILSVVPPKPILKFAKGDSGATNHYAMLDDEDVLENVHDTTNGPTVTLPNGDTLTSTRAGYLPLPAELSTSAKKATLLKNLKSATLISFGQLCDDGCEVILNKKVCDIYKNNKIILQGTRNRFDGLWDIPLIKQPSLPPPPKLILPSDHSDHKLNVIIRKDKTKMELAQFDSICSPFSYEY